MFKIPGQTVYSDIDVLVYSGTDYSSFFMAVVGTQVGSSATEAYSKRCSGNDHGKPSPCVAISASFDLKSNRLRLC